LRHDEKCFSVPGKGTGEKVTAMIAVALDPTGVNLAIAGRGAAAIRRCRALGAGGAANLLLFSDQAEHIEPPPGAALRRRLPGRADMARLHALWVAGLPPSQAAELAALARSLGVLVNVEDRPELCDFHNVAEVRRGDLLLTVSTGGAAPGLSARIRARLAAQFGPEWADRVALLRRQRAAWRVQGADVPAQTDALLQATGWLA
jgi:precorrin-2 dehydrogenase/sirohydrochlorin ferrochelatase